MLQRISGIVLRTVKYKDTSFIADIYTDIAGRASFLVSTSRSRKSPVKSVLFQPLALIELEADIRPTSTIHRIKEAKSCHPFATLPYEPYKSTIALFLAEFLNRAVREEIENKTLFSYLYHSIVWLDECRSGFTNFHLVFLIRLTRFLGFYPNLEGYTEGCSFDLLNACFTTIRPNHTYYLAPDETAQLFTLTRVKYETMHLLKMNRTERRRCLNVIEQYYRLHLPEFPELKSLEILKTLFD